MTTPWMKFYPTDWRSDPKLRICSLAARGLWMELLCIMHEANPRGFLVSNGSQLSDKQLAALVGTTTRELNALLNELEAAGVFSRDENGTIYSRRMVRDAERQAKDKANGHLGGAPGIRRGSVAKADRVRPYRKSDSPAKTARILQKTDGHCYWCNTKLVLAPATDEQRDDGFHIDHLVPVCDGGTNDESNLVPVCAVCSHDRSRVGWPLNSRRGIDPTELYGIDPTLTPTLTSDTNPDTKAQIPEARYQKPEGYPSQEDTYGLGVVIPISPLARDRGYVGNSGRVGAREAAWEVAHEA